MAGRRRLLFIPAMALAVLAGGIPLASAAAAPQPQVAPPAPVAPAPPKAAGAVNPLSASPSNAYGSAVLADSPTLYYRFNETGCCSAADSSGQGNGATYQPSGVTYGVPGALVGDADTAVTGTTGVVSRSAAPLPAGAGARTVEAWFKTTDTQYFTLLSYGTNSLSKAFHVLVYAGGTILVVGWGNNAGAQAPYVLNDGRWHHVAITYDGNVTATIYVDGQQIGTPSFTAPLQTDTNSGFAAGSDATGNYSPMLGGIDEVAVYPSALTADRISAHWSAGNAVACPAVPTTGYAGAVALDHPLRYYRLGETSGRAVLDSSGNCRTAVRDSGAQRSVGALLGDSDGAASNIAAGPLAIASADALPGGSAARTLETWFKTSDPQYSTVLSYGTSGTANEFDILVYPGGGVTIVGAGDNVSAQAPYPLHDGQWHHLAVTYDGNLTGSIYVDGQLIGSGEFGVPLQTSVPGNGLGVGADLSGTGYSPFLGSIDEVAVYATALTAGRVTAHWSAGNAAACPPVPASGYAGAVAWDHPLRYFRLGQTSGQAALDYSGNCATAMYPYGIQHVGGALVGELNGAVSAASGPLASVSGDSLPAGSSARTLETWFATTNSQYSTLLSYGTSGTSNMFDILVYPGGGVAI